MTNQKEFRIEKVITRKSDRQYIKWSSYDKFFSSWIIMNKDDQKRINIFNKQDVTVY